MAKRSSTRTPRAAGQEAGLAAVSTAELAKEMSRRQREMSRLQRKRERLASQLQMLDAELQAVGALSAMSAGGGTRVRPKNESSLADALVKVLKNKTMGVSEAAEAVRAAGYQSNSANFRTVVNQTLIKDDRFENVSRGKYRAV